MIRPKYITTIDQVQQLSDAERSRLQRVCTSYAFRTNDYYLSLIRWSDEDDPIRKIVMPSPDELDDWGKLDAAGESEYTVLPGLEHKYASTALLLVNDVCGTYCRFCSRKRLFMQGNSEVEKNVAEGVKYIKKHKEITNVLLTGGDPLMMSTGKLEDIIRSLREIPHVKAIRIGTKMPAFNPFRILNDPGLAQMLEKYSNAEGRIYVMTHFNHPREFTEETKKAVDMLQNAALTLLNQTPLLRGINDEPETLAELFNELANIGVSPYYVFQCQPTRGNRIFSIPLEESFEIFEKAQRYCSGLAKRARFVMSHSTGKVEIVGKTDEHTIMRYHWTANGGHNPGLMFLRRNPNAYWLDDYEEAAAGCLVSGQ